MKVHDRGSQWNDYVEIGFGLSIEVESDQLQTISLASTDSKLVRVFYTVDAFVQVLGDMVDEYKLRWQSKNAKSNLVIYTDNLLKIAGYFGKYMTDSFGALYIQLFEFFEFRDITRWKDLHDATEIANYAQYLIDNLFIPNKYFYLTPNQVPRRAISKACDDATAYSIYPKSYFTYTSFRKALFGGICYVPYSGLIVEEPMMCLDLTSAYIYDLLIEKHCITPFKAEDPKNWEYYLEANKTTSIGNYTVKYSCVSNKIRCFKDVNGNKFELGEHEVVVTMTNIDLKTLFDIANISDITCNWLYSSNLDNLPKYIIHEIVKQYLKKIELKDDEEAYNLQKSIVNGIFGDCIRDFSKEEFESNLKKPSVAPQWGIWCCSYAKKNLLKLANKVQGWLYSDTDSIYCYDNEYNRKLLKEYNDEAQKKVKEFCKKYNYDYELLKDLGTFKIEKKIKKFKAVTQKIYMYTTTDNKFHLTCAGLDQSTVKVDESLYTEPIKFGSRLFKYIDEDGYHEKRRGGLDMIATTIVQAKHAKKQY